MALTGPRSPMRSLRLLLFLPLLLPALLSRTLVSATVSGAGAAAADDDHDDPCPAISDGGGGGCHVSCFRPDPVCGENGVTYWCGCPEAACAGARVAKRGFCGVGNGGAGLVSGQALLLVHIVWLFVLGFAVLFGFL
uniref:Kazal-like domain-containing protein n=1 Tax=Ananas comosus var. bracteatus TaxID=296719 RepID=A0A6V7PFA0_ANACO|nr:unnamed protein product [Ananas comosus var. bracteatus]